MAWHEVGDAAARPVLLLHGGPGGRTRPQSVAWFDGLGCRVIAHDQRGCGASTPPGAVEHNTLPLLVADIERLREHLGIARWAVAGGSWGSLLAIAYAARHPDRVDGLFLRSSFLGRQSEVDAFFAHWAAWLGADGAAWLGVTTPAAGPVQLLRAGAMPSAAGTGKIPGDTAAIPAVAPADEGDDAVRRARVADAWERYEAAQSHPGGIAASGAHWSMPAQPPRSVPPGLEIQRHYLAHACFVDDPERAAWLAALAHAMSQRPVALVHGLADAVCAPAVSHELASLWPHASLDLVAGGGHAMDQPVLQSALRRAARDWVDALGTGE